MTNLKICVKNFLYGNFYKYKFINSLEKQKDIKKNIEFKGIHDGKRCFVVGNGPSIKEQNLSLLKDDYVFMVNQSMRMSNYYEIHPQFHILADPRYYNLDPMKEEDLEVINLIRSLSKNKELTCFFPINAFDFTKKNGIYGTVNTSFFMPANTLYEGATRIIDLANTIYAVPTVVQFGIQIAIYMGFKEIYLLGCDMTGFEEIRNTDNSMQNAYAYELSENEKKRMQKSSMHSGEELFYAYARDYTAYRLLNSYCNAHNVSLMNATRGGLLDNIPRKRFEDLF